MSLRYKIMGALTSFVAVILCLAIFTADKKENIVGQWARQDNVSVDFFREGVWECEEDFEGLGGTWKLRPGKIVMEDLLGNTFETAIDKDEKGEYIIIQGKTYYKKGK